MEKQSSAFILSGYEALLQTYAFFPQTWMQQPWEDGFLCSLELLE